MIDIEVEGSHKRADLYLSCQLNISRSKVQQFIREGKILLNGKIFKPSAELNKGDRITGFIDSEPQEIDLKPLEYPLKIVYEDSHIMVIDKDKGMVVHPAKGHKDDTLVNAIINHCKDLKGIGGELRPGIVHRIDKDTAGLLVVAKDEESYGNLQRQFAHREIEKSYLAIVYGCPEMTEGAIVTKIGRSEKDRKKFSVRQEGKEAVSHYKVLKTDGQISLVEVMIKTGRTHQIRVHLSHIKHPIVGDNIYGKKNFGAHIKDKELLKLINDIDGQVLLAYRLSFIHPVENKKMEFKAEIREDMKNLINYLEKRCN